MGLATSFSKLFQGDLKGAVDWLYLDEQGVAAGEAADARNLEITKELEARGLVSAQEAIASEARLESSAIDTILTNPDFSPYVGFQESLAESYENVTSGVRKGLGSVLGIPFKILPWQFWALLVAALVVYTFPIWFPPVHAMVWGKSRL